MKDRKLRVFMTVVIIVNLVAIALILYKPKENWQRTENGQLTEQGALQFVTPAAEKWADERSEIKSIAVHPEEEYEAKLITRNGQSYWRFSVSVTVCSQNGTVRKESVDINIDAYTGESLGVSAPLIDWDSPLMEHEALELAAAYIQDYEKENKNIVSLIVHTEEGGYTAKQKTVKEKLVWEIMVTVTAIPVKSYQGGVPITGSYFADVDAKTGEITHFAKSLNAVWYNGK